jgi:cell division protease FtsH
MDEMCMTLGGRAAEDIVFGRVSTGALSDLERITKMAYGIVTVYGMNDKIGNVSFYDSKGNSEYSFTKPYSDDTAKTIDEEVRNLITECYDRTKNLLTEKKEELEIIAQELLSKEIIFQNDLERLIGKRPFENETSYETYTKNTNGQHDDQKLDENKIVNGIAQNKNESKDNYNLDKQ